MSLQIPLNLSQTNGHYTFTVPAHGYQSTVDIDIAGAGGGAGGSWYYGAGGHGGNGARIQGSLTVSPGDVIDVYLGAGGKRGGSVGSNYNAGGAGGYGAQIGNMNTGGQTRVWPVTLSYAWSQFMNDNAVWVNSDGVSPVNSKVTVIRYITITQAGWYNFIAAADNDMIVYLNGTQLYEVAGFTGQHGNASSNQYLPAGTHTLRMEVTNWGGPAGFAIEVWHPNAYVVWTTRSVLDPSAFSYDFYGGDGGSTQGDGGYVYPAAGGGGGASAVFVNGNLVLVAGGGGGGGAEGGHGAGGGPGYDAGSNGGGSPLGNRGETGSPGYDIGGTPGGGGGYNGGSQGTFVYYDDAPSNGAKGGTNYNSLNLTYSEGSGVYTVPKGVKQITVTLVGGGGGGAGCSGNEEPVYTGGGGGGGYSTYAVLDVTPGQQIPWTVGTGGYGGSVGNYGSAGSATTFGDLTAAGGQGGTTSGGAPNGSDGTYVYAAFDASGGAGGYPNGGQGGAYSEGNEVGYGGRSGTNGSVSIQIGTWSYGVYSGSGNSSDGLPGFCNFTFYKLGAGNVKVNGAWKPVTDSFIKVNNSWKQLAGVWVKVNDTWKLVSSNTLVTPTFTPA